MEQGQQSNAGVKEDVRQPFHIIIEPIPLDKLPAHPGDVGAEPEAYSDIVNQFGRLFPCEPRDSDLQKQRWDGNKHSEFYPHIAP